VHVESLVDLFEMLLDGRRRDAEGGAGCRVSRTRRDVLQDLKLARGQTVETSVAFAEEKQEYSSGFSGTHGQPLSVALDRDGVARPAQGGVERLRQVSLLRSEVGGEEVPRPGRRELHHARSRTQHDIGEVVRPSLLELRERVGCLGCWSQVVVPLLERGL